MYKEADQIARIIADAQTIVIMQADNPDGDSLGSALALEHILGGMGKDPALYCGVDIPSYLRYLPGWDRVQKDLPQHFDVSIIVDTSAISLFEALQETPGSLAALAQKPCVVIDHHDAQSTIPFVTVTCNYPTVSTSEAIYELSGQLDWPLNSAAKEMIVTAIMSDSLGLTTEATSSRSIQIVAELVEAGVSIPKLEEARRGLMRKSPNLVHYKGQLLQRVEYFSDNRIAAVVIPWSEIERYSPEYNPSMLVIEDMRMTIDTEVAIAFKQYPDGKVTAKVRCNRSAPIATELAKHFGGGGHAYASGFKVQTGQPLAAIKAECIAKATELLDNHKQSRQS